MSKRGSPTKNKKRQPVPIFTFLNNKWYSITVYNYFLFLFNKIREDLGRNPNSKRGPHRMNNIAPIMNNPSKRNTLNGFGKKDGFQKAKERKLGAKSIV